LFIIADGSTFEIGMSNIFWGALIITIGLVGKSSVFLGDFSPLNILFDGLGLFFVGKGAHAVLTKKPG
jgi:hypothetical protein